MQPATVPPGSSCERQWFTTTHWTIVRNAADSLSPESTAALETLCRSYWYPLYAFVRRKGHDPETARDLTQEFFAQLLSKRLLHAVDPTKGRFRSWLLGVMKHFLAHEWTKARAQKRGGGQPQFSLDELEAEQRYQFEPITEADPETIFDRRWAFTILDRAASRLRTELDTSNRPQLYSVLKQFISTDGATSSYDEAARELAITPAALKSLIHRARARYQELIRDEISQTVTSESDVDDEIRYLLQVIRR